MYHSSALFRALGLFLVVTSNASCSTFLVVDMHQERGQKAEAISAKLSGAKESKSKKGPDKKTKAIANDVEYLSTGDWEKDCRVEMDVTYPEDYKKDEETCRIGMTTEFNVRKNHWEDDYALLGIQVKDWEILANEIPSKRTAQNCENQLAKEHGCAKGSGGRNPKSPIHVVYKVRCYKDGQPTICVANPRGRHEDQQRKALKGGNDG